MYASRGDEVVEKCFRGLDDVADKGAVSKEAFSLSGEALVVEVNAKEFAEFALDRDRPHVRVYFIRRRPAPNAHQRHALAADPVGPILRRHVTHRPAFGHGPESCLL